MKKFVDAFKRNTVLKVFSLLIAILLWAFVQLNLNPEISYESFDIPITITGDADINSEGYVISSIPKNCLCGCLHRQKRRRFLVLCPGEIRRRKCFCSVQKPG